MALLEDLQKTVKTLEEFLDLTIRVLHYIPEVITSKKTDKGYVIIESRHDSSQKFTRPYSQALYIDNDKDFSRLSKEFIKIISAVRNGEKDFSRKEYEIVDKITYTIQQSIGIALDLLGNQNANRKHVGNRFEDLIRILVTEIGVTNKKVVLKIPYEGGIYSCETDFVFSPYGSVKSSNKHIDEKEIVVSLKTSSKDRMGKIFIDKLLMSKFVKRDVKVIGIFLNDIQRKEENSISYTFVAGLFMVYTKFLVKLDGVYFVDPPPNAKNEPYNKHVKKFSEFLLLDAKKMLSNTP